MANLVHVVYLFNSSMRSGVIVNHCCWLVMECIHVHVHVHVPCRYMYMYLSVHPQFLLHVHKLEAERSQSGWLIATQW